ncbi:digestive cysteine proteinase 2-like [Chiloscyllium punctatum]|uniref:digestive cysteine proteinase 2-like n=1 Tax=Chiloscyllium punctatum TaxID=137246 RepID=UPI003B6331D7
MTSPRSGHYQPEDSGPAQQEGSNIAYNNNLRAGIDLGVQKILARILLGLGYSYRERLNRVGLFSKRRNRGRVIKVYEIMKYMNRPGDYCRFESDKIAAKITAHKWVWGGEAALEQAVREIGPITAVINASLKSFQHYKGGVYYDENCNGYVTDEVLVVGFGIEDGMKYWLVKNSWGTDWGDDGYIKIAKDRGNHCEIASFVRHPIV